MFNKSSGLSLTQRASGGALHQQNSTHLGYSPRTGPSTLRQTGPWAQTTTHGKASFASVMDSQDMSKGIARSTAFDMQQEAEQQLRHQIRDAVAILKKDEKSVKAVREHIVGLKRDVFNQSAYNGLEGSMQARKRIRERRQQQVLDIEMFKHNI